MPPLCQHHASVYATRTDRLRFLTSRPERTTELELEAAWIAKACPLCPKPSEET